MQGDVGKKLLKENVAEIESAVAFYQNFAKSFLFGIKSYQVAPMKNVIFKRL